jgi:hypothetical protein
MARKQRKIAQTIAEPTLRTTEVEIAGKKYTLCFDLAALAEAERHFRRAGETVNLLAAFPEISLSSVMVIFPCALHKFHPDISYKAAQDLIGESLPVVYAVAPFIAAAWEKALPDTDAGVKPANPSQP